MRLVIVRHGVTDWNAGGRLQGRTDIPLNEEGSRQAEAIARRLAGYGLDRILSSPMRRAMETARPAARTTGLPLEVLETLVEADMGLWEGLTWEEIRTRYPALLAERDRVGLSYKGHGGESVLEVMARSRGILEQLKRECAGKTVCVVTHASPARHLVAAATLDPEHRKLRMRNASVSILRIGAAVEVECLDDVTHLP